MRKGLKFSWKNKDARSKEKQIKNLLKQREKIKEKIARKTTPNDVEILVELTNELADLLPEKASFYHKHIADNIITGNDERSIRRKLTHLEHAEKHLTDAKEDTPFSESLFRTRIYLDIKEAHEQLGHESPAEDYHKKVVYMVMTYPEMDATPFYDVMKEEAQEKMNNQQYLDAWEALKYTDMPRTQAASHDPEEQGEFIEHYLMAAECKKNLGTNYEDTYKEANLEVKFGLTRLFETFIRNKCEAKNFTNIINKVQKAQEQGILTLGEELQTKIISFNNITKRQAELQKDKEAIDIETSSLQEYAADIFAANYIYASRSDEKVEKALKAINSTPEQNSPQKQNFFLTDFDVHI